MADNMEEGVPLRFGGDDADGEPLIVRRTVAATSPAVRILRPVAFAVAAAGAAALLALGFRGGEGQASGDVVDLAASEAGPTFSTGPAAWTQTKAFAWETPSMTLAAAFEQAFSEKHPWQDVTFEEGRDREPMTKAKMLQWVDEELFGGPDPFAAWGGSVPLPWTAAGAPDQVDPGHYATYSRRQTCFIATKSLMGAGTAGYANGLKRYLSTPAGDCTPRSGDFGRSLFFLLATCAADPSLADGAQGPLLLVAKAKPQPSVDEVRGIANDVPMTDASLRVCQYNDGAAPLLGIPVVPAAGCAQPTAGAVGRDYMTATGLKGQALQDISASWLGGYIWGYGCGLGGGQDERLMTYMPEVFLFAFFLSEASGTNPQERHTPQLRQPAFILGARLLMQGLDGTAAHNDPPMLDPKAPMTSDLVDIDVEGKPAKISNSRPFLAFMSENQDFEISDSCMATEDAGCDRACRTRKARINRLSQQRAVDDGCPSSFGRQVRAWYGSTALTSYAEEVQGTLKTVVKSLGTGPWGSGLWWGDTQLMTMAMWIGHALAAKTWGGEGALPLDLYTYSAFTENPGNQCYAHSKESCKACLERCGSPPPSAYWLPGFAYSGVDPTYQDWGPPEVNEAVKACVVDESSCGEKGLGDIFAHYETFSARQVWDEVEAALQGPSSLQNVGVNPFDALLSR